MTPNDHLHNAVMDRSAWGDECGRAYEEVVERLTALAIADFAHQHGPRGVSLDGSIGEVNDNTKRLVAQIGDRVNAKFADYVYETFYRPAMDARAAVRASKLT